jgi:hypothetical protein
LPCPTSVDEKRPGVLATPSLLRGLSDRFCGRVSQAQRMGKAIRAAQPLPDGQSILLGGIFRPGTLLDQTRSYKQHRSHFSCTIQTTINFAPSERSHPWAFNS